MKGLVCGAGVLLLAAAGRVGGAEIDRGDLRAELSASLRSIYTMGREIETEDLILRGSTRRSDSWLLLTRARLDLEAVWKDEIYGELIYDHEVRTGSGLDSLGFAVGDAIGTRTFLDADRVVSRHRDGEWRHSLYRAWVRFESEALEVTLGRQRIALGRGRLWNPTDLFNPIFPLAIEGDQRIGHDAAVVRAGLREGLRAVAIWAPQRDPDEHRAAFRLEQDHTVLDAALMAGRFGRDWVFGVDFAANWGDAAFRGEATYTHLRRGGRIWQAVASIDYTFSLGTGVYVLAEHLFNENTVSASLLTAVPPSPSVEAAMRVLARIQEPLLDRITTISEDLTGFQVSYEFDPFLRGGLAVLYDWHGGSAAFAPSLSFSPGNDLVLTAAAQLFWGHGSASEYGGRPGLLILQVEAYF